jgi:predicted TIM-barrel fold metal-dependent hydrolase
MNECPNLWIDFSARISELGRQPCSTRRLLTKYQDRILFAIDAGPDLGTYRSYWRFLETDVEYFDYSPHGMPNKGRWQIYGLNLEREVLKKIYHANAARLWNLRQA